MTKEQQKESGAEDFIRYQREQFDSEKTIPHSTLPPRYNIDKHARYWANGYLVSFLLISAIAIIIPEAPWYARAIGGVVTIAILWKIITNFKKNEHH